MAVSFVITEYAKGLFSASNKVAGSSGAKPEANGKDLETVVDYVRPFTFRGTRTCYRLETASGTHVANGLVVGYAGSSAGQNREPAAA